MLDHVASHGDALNLAIYNNCWIYSRIQGFYPKWGLFRIAIPITPYTPWIHAHMSAECIHGCRVHPMGALDHTTSHDNVPTLAI